MFKNNIPLDSFKLKFFPGNQVRHEKGGGLYSLRFRFYQKKRGFKHVLLSVKMINCQLSLDSIASMRNLQHEKLFKQEIDVSAKKKVFGFFLRSLLFNIRFLVI